MKQVLIYVGLVIALAAIGLGLLWVAGQLLVGLSSIIANIAELLLSLIWFLVLAFVLGGASYFITSTWRPSQSKVTYIAEGRVETEEINS